MVLNDASCRRRKRFTLTMKHWRWLRRRWRRRKRVVKWVVAWQSGQGIAHTLAPLDWKWRTVERSKSKKSFVSIKIDKNRVFFGQFKCSLNEIILFENQANIFYKKWKLKHLWTWYNHLLAHSVLREVEKLGYKKISAHTHIG